MKEPSNESVAVLEATVRRRVGLDPQSTGDHSVRRAVCQYMADRQLVDGDACVEQLLRGEAEFESFIEALLVPETWFFRDRQPYECLRDDAARRRLTLKPGEQLRVLSIPCGTGEEPYSIAMVLLDLGLRPSEFQVYGVDLSRKALSRAADAVYTKASFRGDEAAFPGLRDRYLEAKGDGLIASAVLRRSVRFSRANLVSPLLLADQPPYHVIFCRNVLIYLHAEARRAALANLRRIIEPDGLLYVGHVEARLVNGSMFRPLQGDYPFAFVPVTESLEQETPSFGPRGSRGARPRRTHAGPARRVSGKGNGAGTDGAERRAAATHASPAGRTTSDPHDLHGGVDDKLISARLAANAGRLDQAETWCREVLAADPAHAEALCLMGVVSKTRGQTSAAESLFQKVLYVNPGHEEALVHMMLLAEQRGDAKAASNFRRRVLQATNREKRP